MEKNVYKEHFLRKPNAPGRPVKGGASYFWKHSWATNQNLGHVTNNKEDESVVINQMWR